MALVKQTEAGLATANTYATAAEANTFHSENGTIGAWSGYAAEGLTDGALLRATDLLDARFAWRGVVVDTVQSTGLPRQNFLDSDGRTWTPAKQLAKAQDAVCLLALHMLKSGETGPAVQSEKIADYAVTYADPGRDAYPDIDAILLHLFDGGGLGGGARNVKLVRWS